MPETANPITTGVVVNDALLDKLCSLAKLDFQGAARENMKADLERMLAFVEKINELDTDQVEPLIHISEEVNHFRADEPHTTITHEEALKNGPKHDSDYFRVPKVLEK